MMVIQVSFETTFGNFVAYDKPFSSMIMVTTIYYIIVAVVWLATIAAGI